MHYDPNPPQSLPTEANLQPYTSNVTPQPQHQPRSYPTTLIVLLIFLIVQLLLAITMLILKIVLKYIGFDNYYPLVIDSTNCNNQAVLVKYYGKQLQILSISFVMMIVCIALSIVLLIITIRSLYYSKKLPPEVYQLRETSLLISSLYHIIVGKVRALMYILQSICLLNAIVTLGYFLSYYINLPEDTCTWTQFNKTNLIILWVIAAVLFIIAWIVWVIIVVLNFKNNRDEVYKYEDGTQISTKYHEYKSQKKSQKKQSKPNNTIQDYQQPKKQPKYQQKIYRVKTAEQQPQHQPYVIRTPYNNNNSPVNTYTYKPKQQQPLNKKNYVYKPQQKPQRNNYTYKPREQTSPQRKNYTYTYKPQQIPEKKNQTYNYEPRKSPKSNVYNQRPYQNPVFQDKKKELYDSPYNRIEKGPYYEGDRAPIDNRQNDKQFKRSRYNTGGQQNPFNPKPKEDHQYLRTLSRHRLDQEQKDYLKSNQNQNRRILPQNEYRPKSPNNMQSYQGGNKPKLHGSYFNDEAALSKKKPENSDEKKKRSGILSQYLRGRHTDN